MAARTREERVAVAAALAAGRVAAARYRGGFSVASKGNPRNLVTSVDRACQRAVLRTLRAAFPRARVMAEEDPDALRQDPGGELWLVDPLDGTLNFVHGCPFFAHAVALVRDGVPVAAAIHAPATRETFSAARGRGARLGGRPVRVTSTGRLPWSLLATGFPYDIESRSPRRRNVREFNAFLLASQGVRRLGSAALDLAYVAAGVFDGYWELALYPWDVAAGVLLVEEAGGRVSDLRGRPFDLFGSLNGILASNGRVHRRMVSVLQR